eukprot:CAMPEP_0182426634 /NCGR_PEP_ID=MMETSP1167-20130531/13146_1 /TAXON_ID=2988 /ORGANISM="Mallomonas Sp, Strain CCMP3275" /LENGTH=237 /DNA_ID=CAMNT_0024608223 /DNA_START=157 /DNA_END=870 /DNA_ORIENTATION=+
MGNSSSSENFTTSAGLAPVASNSKSLHRSAFIGNNNDIRRNLRDNRHIVDFQDEHGFTALMAAASGGRTETVEILVGAGANVDITDRNGVTALMCAVQRGHIDVVDLLLEAGARTDLLDNEGCNVYVCAARAGYRNIVQLLLDHDSEKNVVETIVNDSKDNSTYEKIKQNIKRNLGKSDRKMIPKIKKERRASKPTETGTVSKKQSAPSPVENKEVKKMKSAEVLTDKDDIIYIFTL